ncbi:MAG: carbohydrate-binding domain-containing protein [Clostridia bacterium]|nr:carbohydrate-binding domain-containing protein [Clostridia bacterium]
MWKKITALSLLLSVLLLYGCADPQAGDKTDTAEPIADADTIFTERDFDASYDDASCVSITLADGDCYANSDTVVIAGDTVTITQAGCYWITGTLTNGALVVSVPKNDKVQLVFSGVSIQNETHAALYVREAEKVFLTLEEGTENTLVNGGVFTQTDENEVDAALFSKEDVTINGNGTLTVSSPVGHGIVSKDTLKLTGGVIQVMSASHGIVGKDSLCACNTTVIAQTGKDGLHAENNDDGALGYVYIDSGSYTLTSEGDGISASGKMQINGGAFTIVAGGGSENGEDKTSDEWGNMPGGMPGGFPGGMRPGGRGATGTMTSAEDSTSIKGIKSGDDLLINGGDFTIDAADDAVHSNACLSVFAGNFAIETGDDGFHSDETLSVLNGTITVAESYEGLEGLHVFVSGGNVTLVCDDDGINAAGGTDGSGMGGFRGNDAFGGGASNGSITISGGTLCIRASGDGIDANGSLLISGGHTTVCGPTSGDTATLDYDTSAMITGGVFIGTGASMMAQSFSAGEQGIIALQVGNQAANTKFSVLDADGTVLLEYAPPLSYQIMIYSAPSLKKGESYTVSIGTYSGAFEAR